MEKIRREVQEALEMIPGGVCVYLYKEGRIYPVFRNSSFYETLGCFGVYRGNKPGDGISGNTQGRPSGSEGKSKQIIA